MCGDNTSIAQSIAQELEVGLLEEALGRTLGVRAVGDDDVELVLAVLQELKAIANVGLDVGVLEADAHTGEVLLGDTDDGLNNGGKSLVSNSYSVFFCAKKITRDNGQSYLVDVTEDGLLDGLVLDDLTEDTAISTTNDQNLLGVGVSVHGQVGDHLLVAEIFVSRRSRWGKERGVEM